MFTKQNLLGALAGGVALFVLACLIWGIATMSFFEARTLTPIMKADEEVNLGFIFPGNLLGAFGMSPLYGKWARGHHSPGQGFAFGAWTGFIIGVGMGLVWMGTSNFMDPTGHAVEAILDVLYYGAAGVVISLVYQATAPREAS